MAKDRIPPNPTHLKFLSLDQDWEAEYWSRKLGVSTQMLAEAVTAVGFSVARVDAYLKENAVAHA
jgi:hypothetical protein